MLVGVALLPPVIAFGMSIGQGLWHDTYWSFLLILTNVTCIVLSAILIFFISGIRPVKWKDESMISVSRAVSIFFVSLISLIIFVILLIGI